MSNKTTMTQQLFSEWDAAWQSFKNWRESVHKLAVKTVLHVYKHRNATVIVHALESMEKNGKGADKKALVEWFQAHSPCSIEWNAKAKAFEATMLKKDKADIVKALNDGKAKPWYEYAKKVDWQGWDINSAIQNVINQSQNALKKAKALADNGQPVPEVRYSMAKVRALQAALAMPDEVLSFENEPANESEERLAS